MTQIASEDYANRLIYLHLDTVTVGFNPAVMQQEHRERRRLEAGDERKYDPMVSFSGNESIGGGVFTEAIVRLRAGVRIVPFDTPHSLAILSRIVNVSDALADVGVFDRSSVVSGVDIDATYSPVEIREVVVGGSLDQLPEVKQAWNRSLNPSTLIGLIIFQEAGEFSPAPAGSTVDVVILDSIGGAIATDLGIAVNSAGYFEYSQAYDPLAGTNIVAFATIRIPGNPSIQSASTISFPEF